MDPLIIGFASTASEDLGDLQSRLSTELTAHSVNVVRAWNGGSANYFVVSAGPSVEKLQDIAGNADAALTGIARLVVDVGEPGAAVPAAEQIVRPSPGFDMSLPSPDAYIDGETLVCPVCGGMREHFSPPH